MGFIKNQSNIWEKNFKVLNQASNKQANSQVTAESLKSKLFFFKKLKEMGSFTIQNTYSVATIKKHATNGKCVFFQASKSSQV